MSQDNFNLKKFLVENKLTLNSKLQEEEGTRVVYKLTVKKTGESVYVNWNNTGESGEKQWKGIVITHKNAYSPTRLTHQALDKYPNLEDWKITEIERGITQQEAKALVSKLAAEDPKSLNHHSGQGTKGARTSIELPSKYAAKNSKGEIFVSDLGLIKDPELAKTLKGAIDKKVTIDHPIKGKMYRIDSTRTINIK